MRLSDNKQINGFSALQTGKHPIFDVTIYEQIFGKKYLEQSEQSMCFWPRVAEHSGPRSVSDVVVVVVGVVGGLGTLVLD